MIFSRVRSPSRIKDCRPRGINGLRPGHGDLVVRTVVGAEFALRRPTRQEYAAIYRTALQDEPQLIVNDEVSGFHWWDPGSPPSDGMSPIDTEIARRVMARSAL